MANANPYLYPSVRGKPLKITDPKQLQKAIDNYCAVVSSYFLLVYGTDYQKDNFFIKMIKEFFGDCCFLIGNRAFLFGTHFAYI